MRNINNSYNNESLSLQPDFFYEKNQELSFEPTDNAFNFSIEKDSVGNNHRETQKDYLFSNLDGSSICKPTRRSSLDELKSILIYAGFADPEFVETNNTLHLTKASKASKASKDSKDEIMNDVKIRKAEAPQQIIQEAQGKENMCSSKCKVSPNQRPRDTVSSDHINNQDVLLGRGNRANNHLGNIVYRKFVMSVAKQYKHCSRKEKTNLTKKIVNTIHKKGGRFLSPITNDCSKWIEVSAQVSRRKISQALRDSSEYRFKYSRAA